MLVKERSENRKTMAYNRIRDIKKMYTRSFFSGASSILDVFGTARPSMPLTMRSDTESLSSDWARVGDCIRESERKINGRGA